jgi:putative heme-binding domain-containing protein
MSRPSFRRGLALFLCLAAILFAPALASAADVIPHAQDKPPGPALSPTEAMAKMTLAPGFTVELVAAEPDIVNPVAMTFDERGRIWITESLEYPRESAGPGRDRIKVLEDTDADGRADRFTIFAEGFNIPSGIAVGHGGVWVANAPDILFLQDTDGDGRADKQEVVVTGFGRDDTHELPNSLTWGPDGWLYGLNGVFNRSVIEHQGKKHDFTCALFRIHPKTREFELFCQGTSNPWGVAWDGEGSAFISACVIDHLWHLAESAYYIRQGGPYPPFTAPMRSIVKHKHQKAAYCGIHYFDSDAYPEQYRDRLMMGNIHGGAINVDVLARDGSTYAGSTADDLLVANDAWFMPVVQKTGPDGCLYVLDWYDRYHCYQDAKRDPEGLDRLKGRLYRIRYNGTPRAKPFDLAAESDAQLIERLHSPNVYYRDIAQRLLAERNDPETRPRLERLVADHQAPRKTRLHALWALTGGGPLAVDFHRALLADDDPGFRAWGVRIAGNMHQVDPTVRDKVLSLAVDPAADVRLQVAVAARKLTEVDSLSVLLQVLAVSGDDSLIPHVVWQNLHPLLDDQGERFLQLVGTDGSKRSPGVEALLSRAVDRILSTGQTGPISTLVKTMVADAVRDPAALKKCLQVLTARLEQRELTAEQLEQTRPLLEPAINRLLDGPASDPLYFDAAMLAANWKDARAIAAARNVFAAADQPLERRFKAVRALVSINDPSLEASIRQLLSNPKTSPEELCITAIDYLSDIDAPWVGRAVLENYTQFHTSVQAPSIELLVKRPIWVEQLLNAIGKGQVPATALNANQVRNLLVKADAALTEKINKHWGTMRSDRDPLREEVIIQMTSFLRRTPGDAAAGVEVFNRVCGECHQLHGAGQNVGPDITLNGRNSFDLLLSNVFDPSLVVGAAYQAQTVVTTDGRVLTGIAVEDSPRRIVLKTKGGKVETIARDDIDTVKVSALSMMPEGLEKQLRPQELADLFAVLILDKPFNDPAAKRIPGAELPVVREAKTPVSVLHVVSEVAPKFSIVPLGKRPQVAIVPEYAGRPYVLRTRPIDATTPSVLVRSIAVPNGKRTTLHLAVSHEPTGAWNLTVRINGEQLHQATVGGTAEAPAWLPLSFDLTPWAGRTVEIDLSNGTADTDLNAAYWGRVEIVHD